MVQITEDEYARLKSLEAAVEKMVTLRGDDLCWRDLYTELAGLVGIVFCPQLIAEPEQMLANCCAFVQSLRTGGQYKPVYVEKRPADDGTVLCEALVRHTELAGSELFEKNYFKDGNIVASVWCAVGPRAEEFCGLLREWVQKIGLKRDDV